MMFGRQAVANAENIFKWKRRGESLLSASLLGGLPPEIELSDYGRLPTPDNESPHLSAEESLNLEPIADLDLFFERLYNYYCEKGLWCIIIKWIVELLTLGFTICFSGFFLLIVDWNGLRSAKCGMDAVESGIKPCDLAREALHEHPLIPFTLTRAVIVGYLGIFSVYWLFCFLRFFAQLKDILGIRQFYRRSLHVSDNEIQTMPWASVLEKIVKLQSSHKLCIVKDLTEHDIVMRLMRKHNYLVGMLNKGVLAFPISHWVPGCGPTVKVGPNGVEYRLILTKTLEWSLNWCILQNMFDRNFCVKRDFISSPEMLKKRLMVVGLGMLVLSPFLVIFLLVYLFLRHAEQFYNHPSTASSRRWSNLSRWMFREFNEVDHLFKHRMNSSVLPASDYLKQFPSPIISIVAKFISFISGGFAAILIIIAFLEESLLEGHIFGRNLFWYAAVFGTVTAISRAMVADEILLHDHYRAMSLVVQHTHYMPKRWRGKECSETVRLEFEALFQYTGMMLLEEMASILLTPYLLLFVVPKRVDDILQFIADFTAHIEGVGHVCRFSVFDFHNHGNIKYGSPFSSGPKQRSSQGKMEKSFLSFHQSYPSWVPDAQGGKFLLNARMFVEQQLETRYKRSFRELPQPNLNTPFSHDLPRMTLAFTGDEYRHYLLDCYYTSHTREGHAVGEEQCEDIRPPSHLMHHEANLDDYRSKSHLEASTSVPFLGSVLRHHDPGVQHSRSQWWARSHAQCSEAQASFLEPPEFGLVWGSGMRASFREAPGLSRDGRCDGGWEALADMVWRDSSRLTQTVFMDDFEGGEGEVSLHFDDVYESPPGPMDLV